MPFISSGRNLNDIPEEAPVTEGDYDLAIFAVNEGVAKSGRATVKASIRIEDPNFPNAQPMLHVLTIPSEDDWENDEDLAKRMTRSNLRFLALFGIAHTDEGWDTDDFEGANCRAHLSLTDEDESGNIYNRIRLPRMKS